MKILGFTGTRSTLTEIQLENLEAAIKEKAGWQGLHGDCVGADAIFDQLCNTHGIPTRCRPCTFINLRAYTCEPLAEPANPMARNRAIVADCVELFACPPNEVELKKGSGTWATIRYGKKAKKPVTIFFPSGRIEHV